jgi:hypothetical protein
MSTNTRTQPSCLASVASLPQRTLACVVTSHVSGVPALLGSPAEREGPRLVLLGCNPLGRSPRWAVLSAEPAPAVAAAVAGKGTVQDHLADPRSQLVVGELGRGSPVGTAVRPLYPSGDRSWGPGVALRRQTRAWGTRFSAHLGRIWRDREHPCSGYARRISTNPSHQANRQWASIRARELDELNPCRAQERIEVPEMILNTVGWFRGGKPAAVMCGHRPSGGQA